MILLQVLVSTFLVQSLHDRLANWMKASSWLLGANPRDLIMPVDGDDGFYPTGNELVLLPTQYFAIFSHAACCGCFIPCMVKTFMGRNLKS